MANQVILLAEDNPDDELLTLRALKKNHIKNEVVVTRNGAEALDYLMGTGKFADRNMSVMPLLVLLDLKLPKIDGLEVLRRMRANPATRFIPAVVLTSSSEEQDVLNSYGLGANSYIRKPVAFADFLTTVGQLGMYWLLYNEPPPPVRIGSETNS